MPHFILIPAISLCQGLKNRNLCSLRIYDKESGPGPTGSFILPFLLKSESRMWAKEGAKAKQVQLRLGQIVNFDFGRGIKGKSAYVQPNANKRSVSYDEVVLAFSRLSLEFLWPQVFHLKWQNVSSAWPGPVEQRQPPRKIVKIGLTKQMPPNNWYFWPRPGPGQKMFIRRLECRKHPKSINNFHKVCYIASSYMRYKRDSKA